jgi:hypothetical protein
MAQNFVRYSPELEHADPAFDDALQTVIKRTTEYITESVQTEGVGRAVRDAHAKGYGLIRAEVEILGGLAPEYAQGIYARPGRHEALIRFSNGSPHAGADARLGNAVGMGLKLFGIDGQMLLEDEPDSHTFDYNLINAPIFFCNTVEHYLFIQQWTGRFASHHGSGRSDGSLWTRWGISRREGGLARGESGHFCSYGKEDQQSREGSHTPEASPSGCSSGMQRDARGAYGLRGDKSGNAHG